MRRILLPSILALGTLTSVALAEEPVTPPEIEGATNAQNVMTSAAPAGPVELTDAQMAKVRGGGATVFQSNFGSVLTPSNRFNQHSHSTFHSG